MVGLSGRDGLAGRTRGGFLKVYFLAGSPWYLLCYLQQYWES